MNFLRKNLKIITAFITGAVLIGGISTYAAYNYYASQVSYTKKDGTKMTVDEALNELYATSNKSDYQTGLGNFDENGTMTVRELKFRPKIVFIYSERINEAYTMWYRKFISRRLFR